jgi:hypothetical protein
MPRTRRYYPSNRPFEITLRAREGIPFPPWDLINLIIAAAMARTQRDQKVTLCDYVWMGNHTHILIVVKDAEQCKNFYMELQRKITEYLKRLLGLDYLHLWEGRPSVAEIRSEARMLERLIYFYCNPARAHLVTSIQDYPGVTSWKALTSGNAETTQELPWIRFPAVKKLPSHRISRTQDKFLTEKLIRSAKRKHTLTTNPMAWCACFGITDKERIEELRKEIIARVAEREAELSAERAREKKSVIGSARLIAASIRQAHKPKEKSRNIYVLSADAEDRIHYIRMMKALNDHCTRLYELAKRGETNLEWPPGMFRPPLPPIASAIGDWV